MKIGMIGPSYTARSTAVADEECINLFAETIETPGAQTKMSYFGTPGLAVFSAFTDGPVRAQVNANGQLYVVASDMLYSVDSGGVQTSIGFVDNDGLAASIAFSTIQLLVVSAGRAWCYTIATNTLTEVTSLLAATPIQVVYSDGYFIVSFAASNKFQSSGILDGTTWPGIQVNEVSVFAENIVSIIVSHRELWVLGSQHAQPYQDTGSDEIFDPIPGALIEKGCAATFGSSILDNTVFWVDQDDRGARTCWRGNGYTPQRISTHAVEFALQSYPDVSGLIAYTYQDQGHLFWQLYIPNTDCSWVYDVSTGLWHKRAEWSVNSGTFGPHPSWNHVYVYGKHLVGDWNSGNLYEMKMAFDTGGGVYAFVTDNGNPIRRVRRSPTSVNEMARIYHAEFTADFDTGLGPQPPLQDGGGNPRPPQAMLRWSNDRGKTWSNQHIVGCGLAGQYTTRAIWRRLGQSRYRVYELSVSDPIPWTLVDAYLRIA